MSISLDKKRKRKATTLSFVALNATASKDKKTVKPAKAAVTFSNFTIDVTHRNKESTTNLINVGFYCKNSKVCGSNNRKTKSTSLIRVIMEK